MYKTRFLLADDNGDICVLSIELQGSDKVADIKIEKIGVGPIPTCIQRFDKGQFLVSSWLGDHELLNIRRNDIGCFFIESVETLNNLGPAVDIVSIEKRSDRKLVVSSGAYKHGSLRIIKNCMSIYTMAKYPFSYVPNVYPLNFHSSTKSRFAIRRQHGFEILEVNEGNFTVQRYSKPETFLPDFPRFETLNDTLFVGVIEPHFYVHISSNGGAITTLAGETVTTLPKCSAADVKRYGDIVISKENYVQWFYFDSTNGSLTKVAEQRFPRPIWNVKFANSDDPNCRICFVVPFLSKNFYLVEIPDTPGTALKSAIKIPVIHGKIVVTPILIHFPSWRSYIVCAMDDGSVDYYQYDSAEKIIGQCETLNVGVQPPLLCKIYVQRQLHLILCSDQTTVMKSDKHSLGFCNMDVKDVGFMLPLSAKSDQESVNSLLYYSEGHICLGKIIDKQKMTIQKVHVGETLMHLEHDVDTNVLVASSLITVTPNGQETIDQPQTLVTAFENRKILHWSASEEYKYETGAGPAPIQYIEDITSLVIFGADRFTILDAVQLSRFEEIFCMTIAK
uniref:DNA damage-binding protein 1 n=1 Tax=Panagrolaimus davidi TaxID=227884 RepID=A0A914PV36_9BILA